MTENEASVFKQTAMRIGLLDRLIKPLSEQEFLANVEKYMAGSYIAEQLMYGNRMYWHGSHTPKTGVANPSIIDKVNPKGEYGEIYFSTHFGYALTYALRLDDFGIFKSLVKADELVNTGKQKISLDNRAKQSVLNSMNDRPSNWWIILLKIKPDTRLFHSYDISDVRALYDSMLGSENEKMRNFARNAHGLNNFFNTMKLLRTIDWLDGIPENYPFDREELLKEIRRRFANGRNSWQGYINCEKGDYSSVGLFNKHLKELLVGPLYQVNLIDNSLEIARYGHSVNASLPPNTLPNKP